MVNNLRWLATERWCYTGRRRHRSGRTGRDDETDFLLARLAFALAEAAGELARGAGLLAVVAGEGEEVDAGARVGADAGREDPGVGVGRDDGAACELRDAAGLEAERAPADDLLDDCDCHVCVSICGVLRGSLRGSG